MGSGYKVFTAGAVLTASDLNNYCQEQSVMYFATAAARDSAITAPEEGMTCFLGTNDRTEGLYTYTNGAWREARIPVPGFSATNSAAQTITANTFTQVTLGTETFDHGNVFSSSTFTVPTGYAGKWLLIGQVTWTTINSGDNKAVFITRQATPGGTPTATNAIASQGFNASSIYTVPRANVSVIYNASEGDQFKLCVQHDGTGTIQVLANAAGSPTFLQGTWLGS